jgi:hypothetical protein
MADEGLPTSRSKCSPLTRREFLRSSLTAASVLTMPNYACPVGGQWGIPYEGIYLDRSTYRPGDMINVHCSLRSGASVFLDFVRVDVQPNLRFARLTATPQNFGDPNPGSRQAVFLVAASLPASELPYGVYQVRIPSEALLPENRLNVSNGFPTENSLAYFVVTPVAPGSFSRLLWVHDSLTGVAYGSYAGQSIYPTAEGGARTVSYLRPGLGQSAGFTRNSLPFLYGHGYEFEYIDLIELSAAPPGYLDAYDLVCCVGQFEYVPNEVIDHLVSFQSGGGNVYSACNEFGVFRVRLDHLRHTMTTYKWDYVNEDPCYLSGDPAQLHLVAGIGMCAPANAYETEIVGQTVWPAHRVSVGELVSLPVHNVAQAGWIFEGTGIGSGDELPYALNEYASGLCLEFDSGEPQAMHAAELRLPEGLVVWGARPSSDGIDWRAFPGTPTNEWPALKSGYATATLQQRSSGAQVVSFPNSVMAEWHVGHGSPIYDRMILNIFERLSSRA